MIIDDNGTGYVMLKVAVGVTPVLLIDCPYISNPLPRVRWYKDDEPITPSSKYTIYENGTLKITDFTLPSEQAGYVCHLNNPHGNSSLNYGLEVWGESSLMGNV